jgi:hypothetical protein
MHMCLIQGMDTQIPDYAQSTDKRSEAESLHGCVPSLGGINTAT